MTDNERRYDIDWLRVLAMFAIFFFHCARFFDFEGWHVKNNAPDFGMSVFVAVLNQFIMPLFFTLSAMSVYHALGGRSGGKYVRERVTRLAVPFLFGMIFIVSPQVYIERVSHGEFAGSFIEFAPHYFDGFYAFGGNFPWMGLHLWYLGVLFIFSLITLPLFRFLRMKGVDTLAALAGKPGAVFLGAAPIAAVEFLVALQPQGIGRRDFGGWSLLTYLVFFILGYLLSGDRRLREAVERHRLVSMACAAIATVAGYLIITSGRGSAAWMPLLRAFNSWCWLLAILGFGSRYLGFRNAFLTYANTAVLPFYILHQTVIVIIGFYLAGRDAAVLIKYLVLASVSFVIIIVLYDLVVKRARALRFLFGMK